MLGESDAARRQQACLRAGEIARDRTGEPARALRAYLQAASLELGASADGRAGGASPALRRHRRVRLRVRELVRRRRIWRRRGRASAPGGDAGSPRPTRRGGGAGGALAGWRRQPAGGLEARGPDARSPRRPAGRSTGLGARGRARRWTRRGGGLAAGGRAAPGRGSRASPRLAGARRPPRQRVGPSASRSRLRARGARGPRRRPGRRRGRPRAAGGLADAGSQRVETARLGARCALALGRLEAAVRCFGVVLERAPGDVEAHAGLGEACFGLGDLAAARRHLESSLAGDESDPRRPLQLVWLGRCLEAESETDAALARYQEALARDPANADAHERVASLHEAAGRIEPAVAALASWAAAADGSTRASCLLRAAEIELGAGPPGAATPNSTCAAPSQPIRAAPEPGCTSPACSGNRDGSTRRSRSPPAACRRASPPRRSARGSGGDARARVGAPGQHRSRGRSLRPRRRSRPALHRGGRLDRAAAARAGTWRAAAAALSDFAARHPGDDPAGLADIYDQLGRLARGPARRPRRRDPGLPPGARARARTRRDARRAGAAAQPSAPRLARGARAAPGGARDRSHARRPRCARCCESPRKRTGGGRCARPRAPARAGRDQRRRFRARRPRSRVRSPPAEDSTIRWPRRCASSRSRRRRRSPRRSTPRRGCAASAEGSPLAAFRAAALAAQGPAHRARPAAAHRAATGRGATARREPGARPGPGAWRRPARERAHLRARSARPQADAPPARRHLADAIAALDRSAWLAEVRTLAAAVALDETHADLRTALLALLADDAERPTDPLHEAADLSARVSAHPEARSLLRRAVRAWFDLLGA